MKTTVSILGVEIPLATLDRVTWKTPSEFDSVLDQVIAADMRDLIASLKSEGDLFAKRAESNYQFFQYADLAVKP